MIPYVTLARVGGVTYQDGVYVQHSMRLWLRSIHTGADITLLGYPDIREDFSFSIDRVMDVGALAVYYRLAKRVYVDGKRFMIVDKEER